MNLVFKSVTSNDESVVFETYQGDIYSLHHDQDCCENVYLEDVCGDLTDLIDTPVLVAEERYEPGSSGNDYDSCTWSFYEFRTIKGSVTIKFNGTSNGYYSETASLYKMK